MKVLSILLLSSVSLIASDGFQYSISSDVIWPQDNATQPNIKERIEPRFNEDEFPKPLENEIIVTILIRKNGTVEQVIPAVGKSDSAIQNRLCETIKKWKFHPCERQQSATLRFTVKIDT